MNRVSGFAALAMFLLSCDVDNARWVIAAPSWFDADTMVLETAILRNCSTDPPTSETILFGPFAVGSGQESYTLTPGEQYGFAAWARTEGSCDFVGYDCEDVAVPIAAGRTIRLTPNTIAPSRCTLVTCQTSCDADPRLGTNDASVDHPMDAGAPMQTDGGEDATMETEPHCPPDRLIPCDPVVPVQVVSGGLHTCALMCNGRVYCWGDNRNHQLGFDDTPRESSPRSVDGLTDVTELSAGTSHTCARTVDRTVYCWGANDQLQLGNSSFRETTSATGITVLDDDPVEPAPLSDVLSIHTGWEMTCARRCGKPPICWGASWSPTSEVLANVDAVTDIAIGFDHLCAHSDVDDSVYCLGANDFGQLGRGTAAMETVLTPMPVNEVDGGARYDQLLADRFHTCARNRANLTLYCWGNNTDGQMPWGPAGNIVEPLPSTATEECTNIISGYALYAVGSSTGCASSGSDLLCWGDNTWNQIPLAANVVGLCPTTVAIGDRVILSLAVSDHVCAIVERDSDGAVQLLCWGRNDEGQVGVGTGVDTSTPSPVAFP